MKILGIETSCDETSASIVKDGRDIISLITLSQIDVHKQYGGVFPEMAAREHLKNIIPVTHQCFEKAKIKPGNIDFIAVTIGPGLPPSLLIGVQIAKSLAYVWNKPIYGMSHIKAHIYANWLERNFEDKKVFPALCLVVSGGHTLLVLMKSHREFKALGETRDDAAGEAFDKVARLLGLGYPGGPIISKLAEKGNRKAFDLPRPMIDTEDFDFSFSGLKTAVLRIVKEKECCSKSEKKSLDSKFVKDMAASFEQAVVDTLVIKSLKAAQKFKPKSLMLSGGVAANGILGIH